MGVRGWMTKRKITIISALLLAAVLALPLPPPSVMAGSQCWYLTDTTAGVPTGADYLMYRDSGDGTSDQLQIPKATSKIWGADEPSNIVVDMDGTWAVTLYAMSDKPPSCDLTVDIGLLDSGGAFGSKGAATQTVDKNWATVTFNITTNCLTLNPGEYLAIKLTTEANKGVYIDVNDAGGNSPSYITSDATAPDYPGVMIISFTVTDYNSDGIDFGSLNPGATDQPADQTAAQGAVTLTVGTETNVPLNIQLKGTDFNGSGTMAISNVKYDDDNTLNEGTETGLAEGTLTASYVTWYSVPAYTADTHECYHWISVPGGQAGGNYNSTFYYQAVKQ